MLFRSNDYSLNMERGATKDELARANAALRTKNGLFARGRFGTSPNGGRVFRASRLFLRATQPRA